MGNVLAVAGGIEFGSSDTALLWIVVAVAIGALAVGWVLRRQVLEAPEGTEKMREIAHAVQEGSSAYLRRQFRTIAAFAAVLAIGLFFLLPAHSAGTGLHSETGIKLGRSAAFVLGAFLSGLTGFTGMWLAVRANVRVANAAREAGYRRALTLAFRAGGVAGMFTVGLGLLGAGLIVLLYSGDAPRVLEGLAFGAALIAMFMRVGGGIFTKAADVGADLVGKVEQNIPEDDPRNAATIADNVGDNVGDCAGMAADLFESYQVTLAAAIILGLAAFHTVKGLVFPLLIMGVGVIVAVVGILAVTPRSDTEHGQKAINRGFLVSGVLAAAGVFLVAQVYLKDLRAFWAVVIGIVLAGLIQYLTEYFTSTKRRPVQEIADASQTGAATVVLSGFSTGLESAVYALILVALSILGAFFLGGDEIAKQLYYVSLVGMGLLSTVGVIVSMDTFGPISDNAQGIAEMSGDVTGKGEETLKDLDAIGNTTKASTKGVAIATAVIAATSLFGAFAAAVGVVNFQVPVNFPDVLVGMLIGGSVVFMFSALAIRAVSRAAGTVVVEVRNQFRDHPGIMDGTEKPDYGAVVDICTQTSLRELVTPGLLAVLAPIMVGFLLKEQALGGFLAGAIVVGQLMAVALSNSGGAWDNAKKLIEEGNYGGKGSENHKATVIGDTVGDPFKDTAGPALNPLLKVMNLVALLVVPVVVEFVAKGDDAARIVVGVLAAVLIVGAVWYAKTRKPIDLSGSSSAPPTAPAVSAGPTA
ncbi:MAG TPA: sodium-translocating pyrophosphatase [Actinomycetota bacterium]|nr:sodium-translocating pyrophosphatase [Actinomycetota bacterium]